MSSYDRLLMFLSELGAGTWDQFREAWSWLAPQAADSGFSGKAWVVARDLSALGHLEVDWAAETWCIAPPVLTMIPRSGGRALLTGARTRWLFDPHAGTGGRGEGRLKELETEIGFFIDPWRSPTGPTSLMIALAKASEAEFLASALGIAYTYSVAEQLASVLPPLQACVALCPPGKLVTGFEPEQFDHRSARWRETVDTSAPGLYRCRTFEGPMCALNYGELGWKRVPLELGIFELMRWKQHSVIDYREVPMRLRVPARAPLPALHARAAVMCSGRLPWLDGSGRLPMLVYENVAPNIAHAISNSLEQEAGT